MSQAVNSPGLSVFSEDWLRNSSGNSRVVAPERLDVPERARSEITFLIVAGIVSLVFAFAAIV
jgi:hypothetical protein